MPLNAASRAFTVMRHIYLSGLLAGTAVAFLASAAETQGPSAKGTTEIHTPLPKAQRTAAWFALPSTSFGDQAESAVTVTFVETAAKGNIHRGELEKEIPRLINVLRSKTFDEYVSVVAPKDKKLPPLAKWAIDFIPGSVKRLDLLEPGDDRVSPALAFEKYWLYHSRVAQVSTTSKVMYLRNLFTG